jgi:chromosome partitioning protein
LSRILAFANQKGGVAKTTSAVNIGAALAEMKRRVLLVDMDPQANLTVGVGLDPSVHRPTIAEILASDDQELSEAVHEADRPYLYVVPSSIELADVEFNMANRLGRDTLLKGTITPSVRKSFDYILLDSPPNLGMLTVNVLTAAREVIIPVATHFYALQGLQSLLTRIQTVRKKLNPELEVLGILATRHQANTRLGREVIEALREFDLPVLKTIVTEAVRVAEAPSFGKHILEYDGKGISARQYREVALEVEARYEAALR